MYRRGGASVPEIQQLLRRGRDEHIEWPESTGAQPEWTGFFTLRTALLALLGEIGGVKATACVREVAGTTQDPLELALCARILEEQQPHQHTEMLIAAAKQLLASLPVDIGPILQLLAIYGVVDAIPDIERVAREDWRNSGAAIHALTLLRRQGGEAALLELWERTDLPPETRAQVAYGLGVAAADSESARTELKKIFSETATDALYKDKALAGLSVGEDYLDPRLVPRTTTVWALPQTEWITARLTALDELQPSAVDSRTAQQFQRIRDELLAELERTQ
jgi:hypothetical protein